MAKCPWDKCGEEVPDGTRHVGHEVMAREIARKRYTVKRVKTPDGFDNFKIRKVA